MRLAMLLCVAPVGCFAFLLQNKGKIPTALGYSAHNRSCDEHRRIFCISIVGASAFVQPSQAQAQAATSATMDFTYADFKSMLESNQIVKVTFSYDGKSMVFVDQKGDICSLSSLPDDPSLLSQLNQRKVEVIVDDYKFEKNLDTARWMMDKVGADVSDVAGVYRGYKTQRKSIPGIYL